MKYLSSMRTKKLKILTLRRMTMVFLLVRIIKFRKKTKAKLYAKKRQEAVASISGRNGMKR
jgi:hypothetical protein